MNYTVEEAVEAYIEAIDIVNGDYDWKINSYEKQRFDRPLDSYLNYSKKLKRVLPRKLENDTDEQERFLKNLGKENFITIVGTNFYGDLEFKKAVKLKLVKEKDNEFDSDAVAVYLGDVKVGYAANSVRTCCPLTSQAMDIQIEDSAFAEYMFYFDNQYHILRLNSM